MPDFRNNYFKLGIIFQSYCFVVSMSCSYPETEKGVVDQTSKAGKAWKLGCIGGVLFGLFAFIHDDCKKLIFPKSVVDKISQNRRKKKLTIDLVFYS
jgi:hypothetical protein